MSAQNPTAAELLAAILAAEARLEVDMLRVAMFGDGSGSIMAPARDWSDDGLRTDTNCEEEVFEFRTVAQLMDWLRDGRLPEQLEGAAEGCAL